MTFCKLFIVCLALGTTPDTPLSPSQDLADGIYIGKELTPSGEGLGPQNCGRQLTTKLGDARLWSQSNENDRFQLFLDNIPTLDVDMSNHRIVAHIDGLVLPVQGWSNNESGSPTGLSLHVSSRDQADRIAQRLGIEPQLRSRPDCQYLVTWKTIESDNLIADPCILEFDFKNVGETPITILDGGQQRGARDNQFRFMAYASQGHGKAVPDTGDPTNFGGLAAFRTLKPGESLSKRIDLKNWFQFEQDDTYQVTGVYELTILDPETHDVIWEELAASDCLVKIVDMK